MAPRIDEIADGIFRISSHVPAIDFTFNEFLMKGEEPLLFHCGHRKTFPALAEAVARLVPLERLRWVSFSHVEADESGALELWLQAAPNATALHTAVGCRIWVSDLTDRYRALADGETIELGGKRVRHLATPHLPHGWDAGLIYEETTATLCCSDLFAHNGNGAAVTRDDIVAPALAMEARSHAMSLTPGTAPSLRRLAALKPRLLAVMHGSSYDGDCAAALERLAADAERKLAAAAA